MFYIKERKTMKKIGIIHTTAATIASLKALAQEKISGVEVISILDDSILPDMVAQRNVEFVRERWIAYAKTLEKLGVDAILSACSTVGEFAEEADRILKVPVYRIDEAMAEQAVETGGTVSVFATLPSTLNPTVRLIRRKAEEAGKEIKINTVLVEGAYDALMNGKKEIHDEAIRKAVTAYLEDSDVIVLAQASMAAAVSGGGEGTEKILTSPGPGMDKLKKDLENI